jgi:hypothetical protein
MTSFPARRSPAGNGGVCHFRRLTFPRERSEIGLALIAATLPIAVFFSGSVVFSSQSVRVLNLWIGYDPVSDNLYHGQVWLPEPKRKFTESQKSGLANAAAWYVAIPGVEIK